MPIAKKDALAAAITRDAEPYWQFCEKIDAEILRRAGTASSVAVAIGRTPRHLVDRAVEEYEALGWQCSVIYDQRDGDYMHLK